MKDIKLIALDMDGVVNSYEHSKKWTLQQYNLERQKDNVSDVDTIRNRVKKKYREQFCDAEQLIFSELAERITKICKETDCYILWSSTWRKLERYKDIQKAREMFNRRGLPGERLISYTPIIGMSWDGHCRGSEISSWIRNNTQYKVIKCAVIDDRYDAGYNLPSNAKFFQIDEYIGITEDDMNQIITYLS